MKFYVSSGVHKELILADTPSEASLEFVRRVYAKNKEPRLGAIMQISEIGFSDYGPGHENDHWMTVNDAEKRLHG